TGKVSGIIMKESNEDLFKESESILMDEVIGVNGYSKNNYLFIKEIIRPEIPIKHEIKKLDVPIGCVFISDLHVGSVDFIEPTFIKFIKWLNSKDAEKVKYIFIAGDLCDGIGIYLSQENDLSVKNVEKQYEILTEYLSKIPNHIKIIVQPGNHDIVGNHEPQQTLEKTALSQLPNIIFGTNPCSVILDNKIRILMYHGYSYDDVIGNLPLIRQEGYSKPCLPMIEVLKRRHLAPSYGASLVIPEQTDHLVISEVPDIFHSGHLHTVGLENYKNTLLINSGTFQGRTSFQKEQGHIPHPGIFAYVDMQTRESRLVNLNEMEF
ncbi:MAG: metallophosphoesterase, partial [Candidatus Aenigmarchaeota archaeon]|nr:metallophosphoesterase [Candidatus Aenigmarchaeota archaeon]